MSVFALRIQAKHMERLTCQLRDTHKIVGSFIPYHSAKVRGPFLKTLVAAYVDSLTADLNKGIAIPA